jgi:hypothetical protein
VSGQIPRRGADGHLVAIQVVVNQDRGGSNAVFERLEHSCVNEYLAAAFNNAKALQAISVLQSNSFRPPRSVWGTSHPRRHRSFWQSTRPLAELTNQEPGPVERIAVVEMVATLALELLGKFRLFAGLNYGCATGMMTLPPSLLTALAKGDLLKTRHVPEVGDLSDFAAMDPADYRTELAHALFQFMRRVKKFTAAWMFLTTKRDPAVTGQDLRVVVAMDPKNDHLIHDLRLVASATLGYGNEIEFAWVHPGNVAAIAELRRMATPFFLAPGASLPR